MYINSLYICIIYVVAPNITMPPLTQTVKSSTNVTFICDANAKPRATIQWVKSGNVLSNTTTIRISSMTMGNCTIVDPPEQCVISSTLQIFSTQSSDSGVYTCNATNEAGYLEKNATLSVVGMYVATNKCTFTASYMRCSTYLSLSMVVLNSRD